MVFAVEGARIDDGPPARFMVVAWERLRRVSRSSLSSEAQSTANALGALEWCKTTMALSLRPHGAADHGGCAAAPPQPVRDEL